MLKALSKNLSSKLAVWLCLAALPLASCSSEGKSGIVSGIDETSIQNKPVVEFCERGENSGNVLCQWVATELKVEHPSGQVRMQMEYDSSGRLTRMIFLNNDAKVALLNVAYDETGIRYQENFSNPDPNDPETFLDVQKKTLDYNPDGTLRKTETVKEASGIVIGREGEEYLYGSQASNYDTLVVSSKVDGNGILLETQYKGIHKDLKTGKTLVIDTKTLDPRNTISPLTSWTRESFTYDPQSGRLRAYREERQDCAMIACGVSIAPTAVVTTEIIYNEAGKIAKYVSAPDGDPLTNVLPDGVADSSSECNVSYDNPSAAPYARRHPLMNLAELQIPSGFDLDFQPVDTFTTATCPIPSGGNVTMTFMQIRLWQAIGATAPGGSGN